MRKRDEKKMGQFGSNRPIYVGREVGCSRVGRIPLLYTILYSRNNTRGIISMETLPYHYR